MRPSFEIRKKLPAHANSTANQNWASNTRGPKDDSDGHTVTSDGNRTETLTVYLRIEQNRISIHRVSS